MLWRCFQRKAGAVKMLRLLVPAQDSQHGPAGEDHETDQEGFPDKQELLGLRVMAQRTLNRQAAQRERPLKNLCN